MFLRGAPRRGRERSVARTGTSALILLAAILALTALVVVASEFPIITADNVGRLQKIADLPIPHGAVVDLFFSPDGSTMITGNIDGEVMIWTCGTWGHTVFVPQQREITLLIASTVKPQYPGTCTVSPDGGLVVTASAGEESMIVARRRDGQELFSFSFGAPAFRAAFSPDGTRLAVGGLRTSILLFNVSTWTLEAELTSDHEYVSGLLFTRDGTTLVAAYERPSNVLKTWSMTTFQETASFTHVDQRIDYHALALAPNGRDVVIATTEDAEIHFISLATHSAVRELNQDPSPPYQLAFSTDGSLLVSASERMLLWNVETGAVLRAIHTSSEAGTVSFSPDGTLLFLSVWEEGIQVWAVAP